MKKSKVILSKLSLKKETISSLKSDEMAQLLGGEAESSMSINCPTRTCAPPATQGAVCKAVADGIVDGIISAISQKLGGGC